MLISMALDLWWLIGGITLLSVLLVLLRRHEIGRAYRTRTPALLISYAIGGVLFGIAAIEVYRWVFALWSQAASQIYLGLAVILGLILTTATWIMRPVWKGTATPIIFTIINFLWAGGYGWFIPRWIELGQP